MAADNVYDEDQEYLIEARDTISELEDLKDKLEEIKLLQKKNKRAIVREERATGDEISAYQAHLFLYLESVGTALAPDGLSPLLDALLCPWPAAVGEALPRRWVAMQPYFYHDIPTTAGDWLRERHSGAQHGRIAVLKPDKWCSYMEYHLKLVSEGLLEGDRWHLISVQENLLFSYLEEPRTHVNIRHQPGVPSAELQEWLAVDPESHFEHFAKEQQGPDAPNFVYLPRCAGTHE